MLISSKLARSLVSTRLIGLNAIITNSNTQRLQLSTANPNPSDEETNFGFKKVKYEEKQGKGKIFIQFFPLPIELNQKISLL
jgi:hypothetical protein